MLQILILLYFILFFFKKRGDVLACGIFAVLSKKPSVDRFKLIGTYNVERGRHSCGVLMDNQVIKGVDKNKLFTDFIRHVPLPETSSTPLIGHTRHATVGVHNEENAHPFVIDDRWVIVHNGVIKNIDDLADKYGLAKDAFIVDSEGLGMLLFKEGYKILDEYVGYAALVWYDRNEPDTLYYYHGASKEKHWDKLMTIERPLFAYEDKDGKGLYLSSVIKSFEFFSALDTNTYSVLHNTVFRAKVVKGKVEISEIYKVNRYENNLILNKDTEPIVYGTTYHAPQGKKENVVEDKKGRVIGVKKETAITNISSRYSLSYEFSGQQVSYLHGEFMVTLDGKILVEPTENHFKVWFFRGFLMEEGQQDFDACLRLFPDSEYFFTHDAVKRMSMYTDTALVNTNTIYYRGEVVDKEVPYYYPFINKMTTPKGWIDPCDKGLVREAIETTVLLKYYSYVDVSAPKEEVSFFDKVFQNMDTLQHEISSKQYQAIFDYLVAWNKDFKLDFNGDKDVMAELRKSVEQQKSIRFIVEDAFFLDGAGTAYRIEDFMVSSNFDVLYIDSDEAYEELTDEEFYQMNKLFVYHIPGPELNTVEFRIILDKVVKEGVTIREYFREFFKDSEKPQRQLEDFAMIQEEFPVSVFDMVFPTAEDAKKELGERGLNALISYTTAYLNSLERGVVEGFFTDGIKPVEEFVHEQIDMACRLKQTLRDVLFSTEFKIGDKVMQFEDYYDAQLSIPFKHEEPPVTDEETLKEVEDMKGILLDDLLELYSESQKLSDKFSKTKRAISDMKNYLTLKIKRLV